MMHVMAALPPAETQATAEVGYKYPNKTVDDKVRRDGQVTGIVRRKHDLMPEQAQEARRRHVPLLVERI